MHHAAPPRPGVRLPLALGTAALLALAACGDATGAGQPEPDASGEAYAARRAELDSLFGADGVALSRALEEADSVARHETEAWMDSLVDSLSAVVPAAQPRAGMQREDDQVEGYKRTVTVTRTANQKRVEVLMVSEVRMERDRFRYTSSLTEAIATPEMHTPGEHLPGLSWRTDSSWETEVGFCPDADGVSPRTWELTEERYHADATRMAGPDNWDFIAIREARAADEILVDDQAEPEGYDADFRMTVMEQRRGGPQASADLHYDPLAERVEDVALVLPVDEVTAGGDPKLRDVREFRLNYLHNAVAIPRDIARARRLWRSGRCVQVVDPQGSPRTIAPGGQANLAPVVQHRFEDERPAAPIQADATSGTVDPAGRLVNAPATFVYTAPAGSGGRVALKTVSRRGIGFGEVVFVPISGSSLLTFTTSSRYEVDYTQDDERVLGTMTGGEDLSSPLQFVLVDDSEDGRVYDVLATNSVQTRAQGDFTSRGYSEGRYKGNWSFSVSGGGTTHNPTTGNEAADGPGHGFELDAFPSSTMPGYLRLWEEGGRHYFEFGLPMAQVAPTFSNHSDATWKCVDDEPESTRTEDESNASRMVVSVVSDPGSCFRGHFNDQRELDGPYRFGAFSPEHDAASRAPGAGQQVSGEYDPSSGIIQGEITRRVTSCDRAGAHDPLPLETLMFHNAAYIVDAPERKDRYASCVLEYTVRWRIVIP